jgi:hypothetical protein
MLTGFLVPRKGGEISPLGRISHAGPLSQALKLMHKMKP